MTLACGFLARMNICMPNRAIVLLFMLIICMFINNSHANDLIESAIPFTLNGQGLNVSIEEPTTKVLISKIVQKKPGSTSPEIIIKIKTPKILCLDFVAALDSSGSMGTEDEQVKGDTVKKALSEALLDIYTQNKELINSKTKRINVSYVNWDDKIEYETGKFLDVYNSSLEINSLKFKCTDTENTDLGVGLKRSVDFLNNTKPDNINKVRRFIIIVTGEGEFINNTTLYALEDARKLNYEIYPIGLGVPERDSEFGDALRSIAKFTNGSYVYSPGTKSWTKDEIKNILIKQINYAMDDIILYNISLADTIHPYLGINNKSLEVRIDGDIVDKDNIILYDTYTVNQDKTKNINIKLAKGLKPDSTMEISFDTIIDIDLPVDVTKESGDLHYPVSGNATTSQLSFTWHNGQNFITDLPTNNIHITSSLQGDRKSTFTMFPTSLLDIIWRRIYNAFS